MKKITLITLLASFFILTMSSIAFAITANDIPPGDPLPSDTVTRIKNDDGSLLGIAYYISSTGATSGIRYRTSAITVNVAGQTAVIDISSLGNKPSAGKQQFTLITITTKDIINALPNGENAQVDQALNDPESIQIGAHIQIYNAAMGQVLATITNEDDVAPIAGKIGFGSQDIADMKSRFQDNNASVVSLDKNNDDNENRLRPSILVK